MSFGLDKQWQFLENGLSLQGVELAGAMVRVPFILGVTVNAGGTQATVEEVGISAFGVYGITIRDINGVEAHGNIAAILTPVNIDTSALDPNNAWRIYAQIDVVNAGNPELAESNGSFVAVIETPKSATAAYNNTPAQGTPSLKIDGVVVADAGAHAATAAAVGDTVIIPIELLNTATGATQGLILESVVVAGDGSLFSEGGLPVLLEPEASTFAWQVLMDTSSAGAKAATFTFISSRSTDISYQITINLTVA